MAKDVVKSTKAERGSTRRDSRREIGAGESPGFDYTLLDADSRSIVEKQTQLIRRAGHRIAADTVKIGQALLTVKERLGYGMFGQWLEAEFPLSQKSAERFMKIARAVDQNRQLVEFPPSVILRLAQASTPESVLTEVLKRAEDGQRPTLTEVQQLIAAQPPAFLHPARMPSTAEHMASRPWNGPHLIQDSQGSGPVAEDVSTTPREAIADELREHAHDPVQVDVGSDADTTAEDQTGERFIQPVEDDHVDPSKARPLRARWYSATKALRAVIELPVAEIAPTWTLPELSMAQELVGKLQDFAGLLDDAVKARRAGIRLETDSRDGVGGL